MLCFQVISSLLCQLPPGWHLGSIESVIFHTTIENETQNEENAVVQQQKNHITSKKIWSNEQGKKLSRINI